MAILNNSNAISSGGYDINNSLRFRSSASAYLSRTPSASNRKTWTWSAWAKLGSVITTGNGGIFGVTGANDTDLFSFRFESNTIKVAGAATLWIQTTQVFRDPSAWYHIVLAIDTTQATSANRIKLYINGNQVTALSTAVYPSQNADLGINRAAQHNIYADYNALSYLDGYLTEVNFIDGQAKAPSDFGETDTTTGSWKPKAYTGTYGTNGFYLKFSDIATTSGSNAGLGKDFSGNANYFNTNNISVTAGTTYDAMIDSPTLTSATVANYCVINPLELGDGAPAALSNGNLTITGSASLFLRRATMNFPLTGKYYCEFTITAVGSGVSIAYDSRGQSGATQFIQYDNGGTKNVNGTTTSYGASFTTGDVIALAVDADGGSIAFYKNNTSQGSITFSSASMTGVNATSMVFAYTSAIVNANFGQRPFSYTPPTGFKALNTYNLPDSTIKKGNTVMDATTYTGNGSSRTVTNAGAFKTDLVWVKSRSNSGTWHILADSVRGAGYQLSSNQTNAEIYDAQGVGFASNGFTLGADTIDAYYGWNINGDTYVGWQWQAGQGSTSSNTSGTITSTVSVNATAGFSVVTYTGNNTLSTVGHGLGVGPKFIIVKTRSGTDGWIVYHASLGVQYYSFLNTTAASLNNLSNYWGSTAPSSTTFGINAYGGVNTNAATYVAYCWAEIAGFSKAFSYTGNASTDGPFVFCNFRPRFILFKNSSAVTVWIIFDTARNTYNFVDTQLRPNASDADNSAGSAYSMDILSNGFKVRSADSNFNGSGNTIIGMAFAENPFKNSTAR